MRHNNKIRAAAVLFIPVFLLFSVSLWAAGINSKRDILVISQHIFDTASDLKAETDKPVLDAAEINYLLDDMKDLLMDYENMLVFAESPYPGEIILAKTQHVDDAWIETDCVTRYEGLFKEIRIRRTGSRARYLRINDIELTYMAPGGPEKLTLNHNGQEKLYTGDIFKLSLPRPIKITRIKIAVEHESNGLIITGIPYKIEPPRPGIEGFRRGGKVLLGTTPKGDDSWVETVCDGTTRPIKEIQLKRTGHKSGYLRIDDIEITYRTPIGLKKVILNKNGREKLYFDQTFSLVLPEPMHVTHIRIMVEHETTGLQVYGIY